MFKSRFPVVLQLAISAMFVTSASGAVTNVFVERIEVTQAVQCVDDKNGYTKCPDNSLELDANEPVVVRVYIGHQGASSCPTGNPYEPVSELKGTKVTLWWSAAHAPNYIFPLGYDEEKTFDVPCSTKLKELRENSKGSATFTLPTSKLGKFNFQKALRIEADVEVPSGVQDSPTTDNAKFIQLGHKDGQGNDLPGGLVPFEPLTVHWMPINYRPTDSSEYPKYSGPQWLSDYGKPAKDAAFMKAIYPMRVDFSQSKSFLVYGSHPLTGAACNSCPDIRDTGAGSKLLDKLDEALKYLKPRPDVIVGYLPDQAIGACRGKGGNGGGAWINGCSFLDQEKVILAHEVGHGVNVWHTSDTAANGEPCWPFSGDSSIGEAGYNLLAKQPVSSNQGDFMEPPASGSEWISPYMWNRLLDKKPVKEWSKCDPTSSRTASAFHVMAQPEPVILVSGQILEDGTGMLDPLFEFTAEGPFVASDPAAAYCFDLEASDGSLLATHCFDLPKMREASDADSPAGGYSFLRPLPSQAARAVLRRGPTVLDSRTASPAAPIMTVLGPGSGDVDPVEVSWTASDPDADDLFFTVLYSPDGGSSLYPVAIDVEAWSASAGLEIDSSLMAGSSNAMFRVLASDGFNTTIVDSDLFEVSRKDPAAIVYAPRNDDLIDYTSELILTGYAADLEDGELLGSSLQWSSNLDGALGQGSQVVLPSKALSPGEHEITLVATDSDGRTATTAVTLSVFLPVRIDIKPFSYPNSINPKQRGLVPLAICNGDPVVNGVVLDNRGDPSGSSGATTNIDVATLEFAFDRNGIPLGASTAFPAHDLNDAGVRGEHLTDYVDTDSDGISDSLIYLDAPNCAGTPDGADLVVHFPLREAGFSKGDTEACVKGRLNDGVVIIGCDTVRILKGNRSSNRR